MIPSVFRIPLTLALVLCALLSVSACVYRLDVQQGNEITQEMISKVKPGMTRRAVVRFPPEPTGGSGDTIRTSTGSE